MKKTFLLILTVFLFSFQTNEKKAKPVVQKIKFEFTVQEVQLIYDALGELPAKQVEQLRSKIAAEANKQLADTTNKK